MKSRCRISLTLLCSALLLPVGASAREPLATRVEHLVVSSARASGLFEVFTRELQLPAVWPYSDYGSFQSGGVSLGNTVLEFSQGNEASARFSGLALEPVLNAENLTEALPERGIGSTGPQPFSVNVDGKTLVLWTNVSLPGFEPRNATIFFCDYKDRKAVRKNRAQGARALKAARGGVLGVLGVKLISLGVEDRAKAQRRWRQLASDVSADLLRFSAGPPLRLTVVKQPGILSLTLQVRSRAAAEKYLRARGWLVRADEGGTLIAPWAIGGLRVRVEE